MKKLLKAEMAKYLGNLKKCNLFDYIVIENKSSSKKQTVKL